MKHYRYIIDIFHLFTTAHAEATDFLHGSIVIVLFLGICYIFFLFFGKEICLAGDGSYGWEEFSIVSRRHVSELQWTRIESQMDRAIIYQTSKQHTL